MGDKGNIVIVGSGIAAMSLSATLKLANVNHVLLEKSSHCGGILGEIHNELDDFVVGIFENGKEIEKAVADFNKKYNLPIQFNSEVTDIDTISKTISYLNSGELHTVKYNYAVIASGSRFKILEEFKNAKLKNEIYYRISPFLTDFRQTAVAVIGSGDNATIAALRLIEYAKKVYLINRSNKWTSRKDLVKEVKRHPEIEVIMNSSLKEIVGDETINKIVVFNNQEGRSSEIKIDKLVLKLGYLPNSNFMKNGIELDSKGYVVVNEKYQTSNEYVYAIGDIVSGVYKRIAIAQGQGTSLGTYFLKELLPSIS
ncbi:MAG TPA: NAD(P)/FAD-dependent oxidoreductase [Bacteroidetes bacterium]|nr:NAD(P)/FAD-dependent oxidoreductase [Bacteroidota bacterium]